MFFLFLHLFLFIQPFLRLKMNIDSEDGSDLESPMIARVPEPGKAT